MDLQKPRGTSLLRHPVLLVLILAHAAMALDGFGLNIALPAIQRDLDMSTVERQWTIAGGALAVGSLLPIAGRITDWIGARLAMLIAAGSFAVFASTLVFAQEAWQAIGARTAQGAAIALLIPATYSMTIATFPDRRGRSVAIGVLAVAGAVSSATGALFGGTLVDLGMWRAIFGVVALIMVAVLIGVMVTVRRGGGGHPVSIDLPGTIAITAGLFGIVFGASRVGEGGLSDPLTAGCLIGGIVLCTLFLIAQHRSPRPLLPLVVFRDRDRAGAMIALAAGGFGGIGTTFFLTLHMTSTLGLPSSTVGAVFVAQTVVQALVTATIVGRGGHVLGARLVVPLGLTLWAVGAAWMAIGGSTTDAWFAWVIPATLTIGVGGGLLYSAVSNAAILHLPHDLIGITSAVANATAQISAALGAAILGVLSVRNGSDDYIAPIAACAFVLGFGAIMSAVLLRPGAMHDHAPTAAQPKRARRRAREQDA